MSTTDTAVDATARAREQGLRAVPVPLYGGLYGWRLLLIRKGEAARFAGLRTPRWRQRLLAGLESLRGADGRLTLSVELVYGHAFKPQPRVKLAAQTEVSLDQMRAMVRGAGGGKT